MPLLGIHIIHSHPNPDTIADYRKYLQTGALHYCPLRDFARARPIQMWIIAAEHETENRDPSGGIRGRTDGSKGVCSSIGQTAISTDQTPQSSLGLNYQPEFTHGGSNGSRCLLRI